MNKAVDSRTDQLKSSWDSNARVWSEAIRTGSIPSRRAGTDQAILRAIQREQPTSLIDIGCGEGWLVRQLRSEFECRVVGVDGSAALIEDARKSDPNGHYSVLSYDQLSDLGSEGISTFDVAVCNFALLDDQLAANLQQIRQVLSASGKILIQTLHPCSALGQQPYRDGWRRETFSAFDVSGWTPMPWYFRTLESWMAEIHRAGMQIVRMEEPVDESTSQPLSVIFVCQNV